MVGFGPWEWLLVGFIALVLFGPGMFKRAAGSLGEGIKEFKRSVKDRDDEPQEPGSGG